MTIYKYSDYRLFLRDAIVQRKKNLPGFTQDAFATKAGMRTTYLTNVLNGRGNFNSDQIYALADELKLTNNESEYLFLLKELDQCVSKTRKLALKEALEKLKVKGLKTESHIQAKIHKDDPELIMKYYGDPYLKIVHLLLQIPRYAENYKKMAEDLNLDAHYLQKLMETLADLKIIKFNEKQPEVLQKNMHLPKDSAMLMPHQVLMRLKSNQRLIEVAPDSRYSFSVTFSGTDETKEYIQEEFLAFLKKIEQKVKTADSENAYQLNFDLFPWNT